MKALSFVSHGVGICATLLILAACGGASPNAASPAAPPTLTNVHRVSDFLQRQNLLPPHHHHKKCIEYGGSCVTKPCCKGLECYDHDGYHTCVKSL
jgi:hypothetical protein